MHVSVNKKYTWTTFHVSHRDVYTCRVAVFCFTVILPGTLGTQGCWDFQKLAFFKQIMKLPMAPKQALYDELRAMGSITPVGVTLKICNINYNCSQLDYGDTCHFLVCSRTKLTNTILSWHNYYLVSYIQAIRLWVTYFHTFLSLHILKNFAK
jgi:hypothetical protein